MREPEVPNSRRRAAAAVVATPVAAEAPESEEPRNNAAEVRRSAWMQAAAFATIYVIWGSTYLGIRIAVKTLPPFLMAASRFLLAGGLLYAILRLKGVPRPGSRQWVRAGVAGMLMLALGNGLVTWAEQRVPSNMAALMITAVPLFTALFDWIRPGGVRPRAGVLVGIGIGAVGMVLLVAHHGAGTESGVATAAARKAGTGASEVGVAALLVAALAWAGGSLYSRYGSMHPHPIMAAAQQMVGGGGVLLLASVARGEPAHLSMASVTATGVGAFLYLTILGSLVAFSAFGWLVKVSTPARLSTTAYVNPVVAVILGWVVLGETLAPRALAGAGLILCAVVVMTLQGMRGSTNVRSVAAPAKAIG